MIVATSIFGLLGSLLFGIVHLILGFLGLFVPPWGVFGLLAGGVIVVGAVLLMAAKRPVSYFIVNAVVNVILVSFVWNSVVGLIHLAGSRPPSFSYDRSAVVKRAWQLSEDVNKARGSLSATHSALTKAVSLDTSTPHAQGMAEPIPAPADLMATLDVLVAEGKNAMKLHKKLLDSIAAYSGLLPKAREACLVAASHQRELSQSEPYAELKQSYEAAARYFEKCAANIGKSGDGLLAPEEAVLENARYVEHAIQFLEHFREDLKKVPDFPGPELQAEVLQAIQRFVQDFERFKAALETFGEAIPPELPPLPAQPTKRGVNTRARTEA